MRVAATQAPLVSRRADAPTPLLHVRDQKASGTDGGTFTSGAWRTRDLNTVLTNEIAGASLAANQITLPAGKYQIEARAPAYRVKQHKMKLRNTTDLADTLIGLSADADDTNNVGTHTFLSGRFAISGVKVLEIQHQCTITRAASGLGVNSAFGVVEVFTDVLIWKIA